MVGANPDLREIVRRLGAGDLYSGASRALVPGPGHSKADRSLSLAIKGGRLLWWSAADDKAADVWKHLGLEGGNIRQETPCERRQREAQERAERERKLTFCAAMWRGTVAAEGTPVETYLRGRLIVGPIPQALRFHTSAVLRYPDPTQSPAKTFPAMVAIATAADGKSAAGLHVTALKPDGSGKADLGQGSPRRMFGELAGAVVQLSPLPSGGDLAVAEGIETALSYRDLTGAPTWAALSTAGLRRFMPPQGVKRLLIAADGDNAGLEAARNLAERASRLCEAVVIPPPEGGDWNDALLIGSSQ